MNFRVHDALPILIDKYGSTVNKVPDDRNGRIGLENKKVMGFRSVSHRVLALDVYSENLGRFRIWIEPPIPPAISGIVPLGTKKCADLCCMELKPLADGKGIHLEATTRAALEELIRVYS